MGPDQRAIGLMPSSQPYPNPSVDRGVSVAIARSCPWKLAFAGAACLVVSGHLLIKAGLSALPPSANVWLKLIHAVTQPLVLLGLGTYGFGTLCWMAALAQT